MKKYFIVEGLDYAKDIAEELILGRKAFEFKPIGSDQGRFTVEDAQGLPQLDLYRLVEMTTVRD